MFDSKFNFADKMVWCYGEGFKSMCIQKFWKYAPKVMFLTYIIFAITKTMIYTFGLCNFSTVDICIFCLVLFEIFWNPYETGIAALFYSHTVILAWFFSEITRLELQPTKKLEKSLFRKTWRSAENE